MAPSQLGIFSRSDEAVATPDLEYHIQPLSTDKLGDPLHRFPAVTVSVCNLRPQSRGTVHIRRGHHSPRRPGTASMVLTLSAIFRDVCRHWQKRRFT